MTVVVCVVVRMWVAVCVEVVVPMLVIVVVRVVMRIDGLGAARKPEMTVCLPVGVAVDVMSVAVRHAGARAAHRGNGSARTELSAAATAIPTMCEGRPTVRI